MGIAAPQQRAGVRSCRRLDCSQTAERSSTGEHVHRTRTQGTAGNGVAEECRLPGMSVEIVHMIAQRPRPSLAATAVKPKRSELMRWCVADLDTASLVAPLCDSPSGGCFFTGPWTVTRSSLRIAASGRCVLSAAAAGAPAGVVSAFAEPSGWCAGAVLDVAGAICALAAPNSWRIGVVLVGRLTVFAPPPPPRPSTVARSPNPAPSTSTITSADKNQHGDQRVL